MISGYWRDKEPPAQVDGSFYLHLIDMAQDFAKAFYHSSAWEKQREYILKRDHYICTEPGCNRVATEVHHIIELNAENINDISITLDEHNLRSLCHECHDRITKAMKANERSGNILEPIAFSADGYPIVLNQ